MKRLLASGHRNIYELGRVFRASEQGQHHHPEFTMLEWYRSGMDYLDLASEVLDLIRFCGQGQFDDWDERRVSYRELMAEHTGLDPFNCSETDLSAWRRNEGS